MLTSRPTCVQDLPHNTTDDELNDDVMCYIADHVNLTTFPLSGLFPGDLKVYYRYHGSLTTPPCSESVIWTIFKETIKISEDQLMKFRHNVHRNYANETDRDISNDFRPTQHLNHRFVYASDTSAIYKPISASGTLVPSSICILAIIFLLSVFTWQNKKNLLLQRVLRTDLCICLFVFIYLYCKSGFCF